MIHTSVLVDKFDGQLPSRRYDPNGEELLSSRIRRAAHAHRLQLEAEKQDPRLKAEREARMNAAELEERNRRNQAHEERHWAEMPDALRRMGLAEQELMGIAAMDDARPTAKAALDWWAGGKLFLTLGGKPGTGKTLAAANLCTRAREFYKSDSFEGWFWRPGWAHFAKAYEVARLSYYDQNDRAFLERLAFVRYLVLDDLGAEQASSTFQATLIELIDARARNQVRTCITTNLTGEELKARIDPRIMRRLRDFGEFRGS